MAFTQVPVLKYFIPQAQTERQGDVSQNGLGFVLLQEGEPVTYASRALTPAEKRYPRTEKELLAQVFGLEHNHHYTFGRQVILWTDQKPLVSIYKKLLASTPRDFCYDSSNDGDLRYKPGSKMYLLTLYLEPSSRAPSSPRLKRRLKLCMQPISSRSQSLS